MSPSHHSPHCCACKWNLLVCNNMLGLGRVPKLSVGVCIFEWSGPRTCAYMLMHHIVIFVTPPYFQGLFHMFIWRLLSSLLLSSRFEESMFSVCTIGVLINSPSSYPCALLGSSQNLLPPIPKTNYARG